MHTINPLTPIVAIWVQLLKHPVPDRVKSSFVIFDIDTDAQRRQRVDHLQLTSLVISTQASILTKLFNQIEESLH